MSSTPPPLAKLSASPLPAPDVAARLQYLLEPLLQDSVTVLTFLHDVAPQLQSGAPMCGLVALSMAGELLFESCPSSATPYALLETATHHNMSRKGELFRASDMLTLAQLSLPTITGSMLSAAELTPRVLIEHMIHKKALLVPYDCDKDHTPMLANGHKAHWCLLVGMAILVRESKTSEIISRLCTKGLHSITNHYIIPECMNEQDEGTLLDTIDRVPGGNIFVFARHGKSRHIGLWRLEKLLQSNANLIEFDSKRDPTDYVVPEGGLLHSLASRVVLIQSKFDKGLE